MIRLTATNAGLLLEKDARMVRASPDFTLDRLFSARAPGALAADAFAAGTSAAAPDATTVGQIKRPLRSLAEWLFRENSFPSGCYLMTGTGIVPPDSFTLQSGDEIRITIEPVGTLVNHVG